jgi:hypothetical protein
MIAVIIRVRFANNPCRRQGEERHSAQAKSHVQNGRVHLILKGGAQLRGHVSGGVDVAQWTPVLRATGWGSVTELSSSSVCFTSYYFILHVGVLISLWLFLFPIFLFLAQPKEFFLDGLKKLEQRSHKCVELGGEYVE